VHSNGYSLVRKVIEKIGLPWEAPSPFGSEQSLGDAILTPTRIYVKACIAAIRETNAVKGMAHITGGGFPDNIPRILPKGLGARINLAGRAGTIAQSEMLRTFNCGIGMIVIIAPKDVAAVTRAFERSSETVVTLGKVITEIGDQRVVYDGLLDLG
jgi:phosphoribosylformylglycinamidine cyclo-ligase